MVCQINHIIFCHLYWITHSTLEKIAHQMKHMSQEGNIMITASTYSFPVVLWTGQEANIQYQICLGYFLKCHIQSFIASSF